MTTMDLINLAKIEMAFDKMCSSHECRDCPLCIVKDVYTCPLLEAIHAIHVKNGIEEENDD